MTAFFNAADSTHTALISRAQRAHLDLATVAAQAERDVLAHFTRRYSYTIGYVNNFYTGRGYDKGNGKFIALEGINPDASLVTDADLVLAMRDTIAAVINWRLAKYSADPTVTSSSASVGISKTIRDDSVLDFPPTNWEGRLKQWDLRAPVVAI